MNLHILPDSKFSDRFYANLVELGLQNKNRCIIRSNDPKLKHVRAELAFAKFSSNTFNELVGDTLQYGKVFIHQFSPLMYGWVVRNKFNELNWCVWGADIYNLPGVAKEFYEPLTWDHYSRHGWKKDWQYLLKVYLTSMHHQRHALLKVNNILTWMRGEFTYITQRLKLSNPSHSFFFYENQLPYESLDKFVDQKPGVRQRPLLILGNSGTDTNNHIDAIRKFEDLKIESDILIPVSYGSEDYKDFLRKNASFYMGGEVRFMDEFLAFDDYVQLLLNSDGLVMNHLRPQGYGNILMMMYLEKPVYMNQRNISIPDLDLNGLPWLPVDAVGQNATSRPSKEAVKAVFSHDRLLEVYAALFS